MTRILNPVTHIGLFQNKLNHKMALHRVLCCPCLALRTVRSITQTSLIPHRTISTSILLAAKPTGGAKKGGGKASKGLVKAPLLDAETDAYKVYNPHKVLGPMFL